MVGVSLGTMGGLMIVAEEGYLVVLSKGITLGYPLGYLNNEAFLGSLFVHLAGMTLGISLGNNLGSMIDYIWHINWCGPWISSWKFLWRFN